jgi:uncharacterized protein (TIGR02444 family)
MEQAFWKFSLQVYRQPGVQDECLYLQDNFGLDVILLLFCAFVGAVYGVALPPDGLAQAATTVRPWHDAAVRNLRAARRALKPLVVAGMIAKSAGALRSQVKAAELESERLEQAILARWAAAFITSWPRRQPEVAIATNIESYLKDCNVSGQSAALAMPRCLMAAALCFARGHPVDKG